MRLSATQSRLYDLSAHDSKMVVADGPVRSGKTMAGLWGFLTYTQRTFTGGLAVVAVQSRDVWSGTIRTEVTRWASAVGAKVDFLDHSFKVSTRLNGRRHTNTYNRVVANNVAAVGRIQGLTLCGAFVTEAAKMEEEFIVELTFRALTVPEAKIVLDCNPEGRFHWLKVDWIDRAEDRGLLHLPFRIADNPAVSPADWDDLVRTTPPGHVARRKLYGEWCDPSGLVWDVETPGTVGQPPEGDPTRLDVAVDSASSSVTHALLVGRYAKAFWVLDEWRHDANASGALSPADQLDSLRSKFSKWGTVTNWVADSADGHFNVALRQLRREGRIGGTVNRSDKRVKEGLDMVSWLLHRRRLRISGQCSGLLRDIGGYSWDPLAAQQGEDKPVKRDDHGCDALRYWAMMNAAARRPRVTRRSGNGIQAH